MKDPINPLESLPMMKAATTARVHLMTLYRMRSKLGAFKQDGVWHIPTVALESYIQGRAARAREAIEAASALK